MSAMNIVIYAIGVVSFIFVAHVIFARATGRRLLFNPKCSVRGHLWHEGDDTLVTISGEKGSGYHMAAYTWKCHRCAAQTGEGEEPPANRRWDYRWISPADDPYQSPERDGDCSRGYRHIRDTLGEPSPPETKT